MKKPYEENPEFFTNPTLPSEAFKKIILKQQRGKISEMIDGSETAVAFIKKRHHEEVQFNEMSYVETVDLMGDRTDNIKVFVYTDEALTSELETKISYDSESSSFIFSVHRFIYGFRIENANLMDKVEIKGIQVYGMPKTPSFWNVDQ